MRAAPATLHRDLVLLGGGHAHLAVLRSFAMRPEPGLRLTLVNRGSETPYSGMLPGQVAGWYDHHETHFDLRALAVAAGAAFIDAEATGLDAEAGRLDVSGREPIAYDLLSINIGATPELTAVPGAAEHAIPVKPINQFLARWAELERRLEGGGAPRLAIVGAGAGGVELAFALERRLAARGAGGAALTLLGGEQTLLPGMPPAAGAKAARLLAERGVALSLGSRVAEVTAGGVRLASGEALAFDAVLWVTQAAPAPWLARSGLDCDEAGFVRVSSRLRALSHPNCFAAGDIAAMQGQPRPKSGVFAVRQGPVLAANLRRWLQGRRLRRFRAQSRFLTLIGTGDAAALAVRGPLVAHGRWIWRWKQWIDRRFMQRYQRLPGRMARRMAAEAAAAEPRHEAGEAPRETMHCLGCGAKVSPSVLQGVLATLAPGEREDVVTGLAAADDAAVLAVPAGRRLVHTLDIFPAICDDPWLLGRIAVNHALGDIYAMGAEPQSVLAFVNLPWAREALHERWLRQILGGATAQLRHENAVLAGGHTSEGPQLQVGFAATGLLEAGAPLQRAGARAGDALVLTKPLGSGTVFAGAMRGQAQAAWVDAALAVMAQSNREAAAVMARYGARACTDVTGFGLLGHLPTVADTARLRVRLDAAALPCLPGALELAGRGVRSSLFAGNLAALAPGLRQEAAERAPLLADPQTAGGLLFALPAERAEACLAALQALAYNAAIIGAVSGDATPGVSIRA